MLNYAGIKSDLLPLIFDLSKAKQGCYMPGSRIPILSPKFLIDSKPDYVLILPWNIAEEIRKENSILEKNGSRFMTAIPKLEIL